MSQNRERARKSAHPRQRKCASANSAHSGASLSVNACFSHFLSELFNSQVFGSPIEQCYILSYIPEMTLQMDVLYFLS